MSNVVEGSGETGRRPPRPAMSRDIAIVGMACVLPGAPDVETFWGNVIDGVDSVTEVSPARWLPELHFDPDHDSAHPRAGKDPMSVSKWGGFVPTVGFDPLRWGIPPASLASIDPAQLFALKMADAALEDAGYGDGGFDRDRASVIYATATGGAADIQASVMTRLIWRTHTLDPLPPEIDTFLPEMTEDGLPGALTSLISGRVANRLDFGGKNLTVDSACASVLVALEIACDELNAGRSDLALCGGVDMHNGAGDYISFTAAHALSPTGRCHSFDSRGDGMTLAEGCGCLVLKRLDDAVYDGDRVYAVVKGVAGSSDGRHLGLTAPRQEGQEKAVRRAYAATGISPAEVGLVEAHGTGTVAGDRTELKTMTSVFGQAGAARGSIVTGSVKSNIGHVKAASAMASIIKSAKAAYHGVLPPTLHITEPNEVWDPATSPFVFLDRPHPWLDDRRLAGVSAFGFGGTNFHAILENHRPEPAGSGAGAGAPPAALASSSAPASSPSSSPASGRPHWPSELFAFRAVTGAELDARLDELAERLAPELVEPRPADRWRLRDIAAAVWAAGEGPVQLALVADDLDDLAAKLRSARAGDPAPGVYRRGAEGTPASGADGSDGAGSPKVAFLFPGPDAARLGMVADVLVAFPHLREAARTARRWTEVMLPHQAFGEDRERQDIALAGTSGPAVAVAGLTLAGALTAAGVTPEHVTGCGSPLLSAGKVADIVEGAPTVLASLAMQEMQGTATAPRCGQTSFQDEIRELHASGVEVFVDVGPGETLLPLVGEALADRPHQVVAVDHPDRHGLTSLLDALARLAVTGVPVDVEALHAGRGSEPHRWNEPDRSPGWIVDGQCARARTGDPLPKGLRPAHDAPMIRVAGVEPPVKPGTVPQRRSAPAPEPVGNGHGPGGNGNGNELAASGEVAAVMEYLRLVQNLIVTGSDIIRSQVGTDQAGGAAPATTGERTQERG